ncbi:alpha/beta fold hydrolase [candidate division TA06 bacterium]|uniref:Alpha/beta fold hydrolase n=1 Tax=candidate division TA06 bacterium TaxID=2250710 RepID=A0A523UWQ1_UNCT6|nr:MAG: alpha/beta fold hydrolase [candidate division TA06 bacterium]
MGRAKHRLDDSSLCPRERMTKVLLLGGILSELYALAAFQILTLTYLLLSPFHPFRTCYGRTGKQVPVLLIHGYPSNPAVLWPLIIRLRKKGFTNVHAITLIPFWGSVRNWANQISRAVDGILARCRCDTIDIVAHSMGGLAAAYYLKYLGGKEKVRKFLPLATPFRGSHIAYLGPGFCTVQMWPRSKFLTELDFKPEDVPKVDIYSFRAGLDECVIPHSSPILDEPSKNIQFEYLGHASILFSEKTAQTIIQVLAL